MLKGVKKELMLKYYCIFYRGIDLGIKYNLLLSVPTTIFLVL